MKSEQQWLEDEAARQEQWKQQQIQRRKKTLALSDLIQAELFKPQSNLLKDKQFLRYGTALSTDWNLYLTAIVSAVSQNQPRKVE
jgi:hypothetical protein